LALSITVVPVALALVAGAVAYSGLYSVAASQSHGPVLEKLLRSAMHRSVARQAAGIVAPDLADEGRVSDGLAHYGAMCEICHGAPDKARSELAAGLYPRPPQFGEERLEWTDEELFWVTKHGIKMTGMPGFGATHEDEEIWSIVAAVRRLPELDPAAYRAATDSATHADGDHDHTQHRR
jgi:mono/diheme cytochrome c family protein